MWTLDKSPRHIASSLSDARVLNFGGFGAQTAGFPGDEYVSF